MHDEAAPQSYWTRPYLTTHRGNRKKDAPLRLHVHQRDTGQGRQQARARCRHESTKAAVGARTRAHEAHYVKLLVRYMHTVLATIARLDDVYGTQQA